jgi:hypothetical protein
LSAPSKTKFHGAETACSRRRFWCGAFLRLVDWPRNCTADAGYHASERLFLISRAGRQLRFIVDADALVKIRRALLPVILGYSIDATP